jgi:hypothetical protein
MFRSGVVALLGLLPSVSLAFADPVGTYDVEGSDPGGRATYRGTVEVARTGERLLQDLERHGKFAEARG